MLGIEIRLQEIPIIGKRARCTWRTLGAIALFVALSFPFLQGDDTLVTVDNYRKISLGMTQDEVEELLGAATLVHSGHKAAWESMSRVPSLMADDDPVLYESRIYLGRVNEGWHQNQIRVAFRQGDGVVAMELYEDYSPTQPQKMVNLIRMKLGQRVTYGQFH